MANRLAPTRLEAPIFDVDVLDVGAGGPRRDHGDLRDLLGRQPESESRSTSISRAVRPGRPLAPAADRWPAPPPARRRTQSRRAAPRAPRRGAAAPPRRARRPRDGAAARASTGRRRPRRAPATGDGSVAAQTARVARAVEPFAEREASEPQDRERGRRGQHPSRSNTVQADPFLLGRRQRTGACPRWRSSRPAGPRPCTSPRAARGRPPSARNPAANARSIGPEVRHGAGVPERVRRLQVDEVRNRLQRGRHLLAGTAVRRARAVP